MVPIPLELYRPIIRQIRGKRDLCAIARVSRFLQGEAERLIYRQLMATGFNEIVSLCRSVVNTLRVGIYVLEFRIRDDITGDVDPATIHRLLCMALERMVNLRYLSIYASTDAIIPRHFPQTFLPKLSVLGLVCAGSHLEYPSYIVSGRPITHLGVGTMRPGFYSPLSSSIGPVRALYITTCPEYALDLEDLPTAFPDLELFSMATFSRDGNDSAYIGLFSRFKKLQAIEIRVNFELPFADGGRLWVEQLTKACGTLQTIFLRHWLFSTTVVLWKRRADGWRSEEIATKDVETLWGRSVAKLARSW